MTSSRCLLAMAAELLAVTLLATAACGTLQVTVEEPGAAETVTPTATRPIRPTTPTPVEPATPMPEDSRREQIEAVAWYGEVHSVEGAEPGSDYLKLWHLNLWPKFGRAVGLAGADPAINAELERIRDRDVRAYFWGTLTCGVGDYGACQLLVTRLSANDGGPTFLPDLVNDWKGTIGRLPSQPGSEDESPFFTLTGEVPVLYAITSQDPAIQSELERLQDSETVVSIWGMVQSRVHRVTGSQIAVDRLEIVSGTPSS